MNQFIAIAFRDLDNNYVVARLDPTSKQIDFSIHERPTAATPIDQLPLDSVEVIRVTESQEDIFDGEHLFQLKAVNQEDPTQTVELASLAETDEVMFRELIDILYEQAVAMSSSNWVVTQ